jgi:hypothetical protein
MAAGAFAAAAAGLPSGALANKSGNGRRVFKLAPSGPKYDCSASQQSHHSCQACKACQAHAKNKLFASEQAAKQHRAHPGCRCGVKRGRRLSRSKWQDLFRPGDDKKLVVVDKRNPRVRKILGN